MTQTHLVAKILLVNQDGKVLVLRRSKTDERRPLEGDIPGGWVDKGETIEAAAVRETYEEAGIKISQNDLRLVYTHTEMRDQDNVCWLFYIGVTDQNEVKVSYEHDQANWQTLDQAIEFIQYNIQQDFLKYVRDNSLL